jgi:hypothetical protein
MALALAAGDDALDAPRCEPTAGVAASLVYRAFDIARVPPPPSNAQRASFAHAFPDGLVFAFPKAGHALERDFKWTGNHHHGIVHLGGLDRDDLRSRAEQASALLGWPAPYRETPPQLHAAWVAPPAPRLHLHPDPQDP